MHVLVLPGDDIGPEITAAALAVVKRVDELFSLGLELETQDVGMASYPRAARHCRKRSSRPRSLRTR